MVHVTFVKSPAGSRINSLILWASNGFTKSPFRNRPRRVRLNYRHPTLARAAVAIPFRDRVLAVFGAAISPFHCGVFPILGSPTTPIVEVIYEHKDFVGWSLDIYRSLNGENFGLGRSESQNDGDQNSDNDNYLQGHVIPHQYTRILTRGG